MFQMTFANLKPNILKELKVTKLSTVFFTLNNYSQTEHLIVLRKLLN